MKLQKILLVRTDRLGDVLLTLPMATALKQANPDCRCEMLTRSYTAPLARMCPDIDEVLTLDDHEKRQRRMPAVSTAIADRKYDAVICVHPTAQLAWRLYRAQIPARVGTGYRWYSFLFTHRIHEHRKTADFHETEYNLHLLRPLDIDTDTVQFVLHVPEVSQTKSHTMTAALGLADTSRYIVLHPGSGSSAINLPLQRYAEVANALVQLEYVVVVSWGPGEEWIAEYMRSHCTSGVMILPVIFPIPELAVFLRNAALVISNSTGPLHLANAVGTRVLGFYPPITACSARRWGPYGQLENVMEPDVPERKKYNQSRQFDSDIMGRIPVEKILGKVKQLVPIASRAAEKI